MQKQKDDLFHHPRVGSLLIAVTPCSQEFVGITEMIVILGDEETSQLQLEQGHLNEFNRTAHLTVRSH
jgi:hypothetical protein